MDIQFVGSLANYNWHDKSDVDLHILIDLSNFGNHIDFINEYLQSKKSLWNNEHNINIFGFPVEVYPEDISKKQSSFGAFSLIKNEWVIQPNKDADSRNVDKNLIRQKYQNIVDYIMYLDSLSHKLDKISYKKLVIDIENLKEKLRTRRSQSIKSNGEYSIDNIVYKMLRKNGLLQKLSDLKNKVYDSVLSLENLSKLQEVKNTVVENDKYLLLHSVATLHSKETDRIRIVECTNKIKYRNIRNRKEYFIEKTDFIQLLKNKFIQKI